jgi:hypothetical protein
LPVDAAAHRPQVLELSDLLFAAEAVQLSARRDFRLLFNSLGAWASQNHLHWHCCYIRAAFADGRFPAERISVQRAGTIGGATLGLVAHGPLGWPVRMLVVEAADAPGEDGPAAAARLTWRIVRAMQTGNVAHNIVVVPAGARGSGIRFYVVPRQCQTRNRRGLARYAVVEVMGLLNTDDPEQLPGGDRPLTEAGAYADMEAHVSLSEAPFLALIEEALRG